MDRQEAIENIFQVNKMYSDVKNYMSNEMKQKKLLLEAIGQIIKQHKIGEREIDKTHKLKILQVSWNLAGWGPSNKLEVQNLVKKLDTMIHGQDIIVFNFQEVVEMKMGAYAMGNAISHAFKPILKNKIRNVKVANANTLVLAMA